MKKDKKDRKKLFPNGFLNSGLWTFSKGLIGTATGFTTGKAAVKGGIGAVIGVANSIKDRVDKNKNSEVGGKNKSDYYEWLGIATGVFVLGFTIYLLVTGQISIQEFLDLNN